MTLHFRLTDAKNNAYCLVTSMRVNNLSEVERPGVELVTLES